MAFLLYTYRTSSITLLHFRLDHGLYHIRAACHPRNTFTNSFKPRAILSYPLSSSFIPSFNQTPSSLPPPSHQLHPHTNMEKLNSILQEHVAQGQDTTNKLLGAAFVVVNAKGSSPSRCFTPNANRISQMSSSLALQGASTLLPTQDRSAPILSPGWPP